MHYKKKLNLHAFAPSHFGSFHRGHTYAKSTIVRYGRLDPPINRYTASVAVP